MIKTLCAFVVAAMVSLAGCDRRGESTGGKLEEVRIGYFANVTHAQAVLGAASGEFAEAVKPAKLTQRIFNAGPSLIEALSVGEVDIGYVGPGPALSAHVKSRGEGIRVVAGAAANGVLIVARKGSGITKLEDLKGRRIATPQLGNTQDIAAKHFVTGVLKQADFTNVVPVANGEQAGLMLRDQIDAAWSPEPWGSRLVQEAGASVVAREQDLWPGGEVTLTLVVTTPEFLRDHPEIVRRVLQVHRNWTQRLASDPGKYAGQLNSALAGLTGKALAPGVVDSALRNVKFTDEPLEATLKTMGQWAYDLNYLDRNPELDRLIDLRILRSLQQEKK